jgi:hypothetical protein
MTKQEVQDVHPNLYHYTDWPALNGIIKTNELWATNIRYLNDQSEYVLAQKLVEKHILPDLMAWLEKITKNNVEIQNVVNELGGISHQTLDLAKSAMDAMYTVTGDDFFVTSFCGMSKIDEYLKSNGLLSQWRGYGNQQGFILVFDTKTLARLIETEKEQFNYEFLHLKDVVYSNDEKSVQEELTGSLETIREFVRKMYDAILNEAERHKDSKAMLAFMNLATRFKHRAFAEENEVRLVGKLHEHTPELLAMATEKNCKLPTEKPVELRTGRSGLTPFIRLFGSNSDHLPLTKIIVGPSKDKVSVAEALRKSLRKRDIAVEVSDIPYI